MDSLSLPGYSASLGLVLLSGAVPVEGML